MYVLHLTLVIQFHNYRLLNEDHQNINQLLGARLVNMEPSEKSQLFHLPIIAVTAEKAGSSLSLI